MKIRQCTKKDFDKILAHFNDYWDIDKYTPDMYQRIRYLHHPIWIYEFGNTAFVVEKERILAGYLFCNVSQTDPLTAYGILFAVHRSYRRQGIGKQLSEYVFQLMKSKGCKYYKAITTEGNESSIRLHIELGFEFLGEPNERGVPVVKNYAGPGEDRVVFRKRL